MLKTIASMTFANGPNMLNSRLASLREVEMPDYLRVCPSHRCSSFRHCHAGQEMYLFNIELCSTRTHAALYTKRECKYSCTIIHASLLHIKHVLLLNKTASILVECGYMFWLKWKTCVPVRLDAVQCC